MRNTMKIIYGASLFLFLMGAEGRCGRESNIGSDDAGSQECPLFLADCVNGSIDTDGDGCEDDCAEEKNCKATQQSDCSEGEMFVESSPGCGICQGECNVMECELGYFLRDMDGDGCDECVPATPVDTDCDTFDNSDTCIIGGCYLNENCDDNFENCLDDRGPCLPFNELISSEQCNQTGGMWRPEFNSTNHFECGERVLMDVAVAVPCNCGETANFVEGQGCVEDEICHEQSDEQILCEELGGRWDELSCGDYRCGVTPPAACQIAGGCDCGPTANFVEGEGCVEDDTCIITECMEILSASTCRARSDCRIVPVCDDPLIGENLGACGVDSTPCINADNCDEPGCSDEQLCEVSNGDWIASACGHHTCGQQSPASCATGGCDCGATANFVEGEGCVEDRLCQQANSQISDACLEYQSIGPACDLNTECSGGRVCQDIETEVFYSTGSDESIACGVSSMCLTGEEYTSLLIRRDSVNDCPLEEMYYFHFLGETGGFECLGQEL